MLTSQIIKACLEEMSGITRTQFSVQDLNGNLIAATAEMQPPEAAMVSGFAHSAVDSQIIGTSYLLKVLDDGDPFYVLTATGSSDYTFMVAKMVAGQLQSLITAYKERLDRGNFFQNLLLDNLLMVDIHNRARKLHITSTEPRAVVVFDIDPGKSEAGRGAAAGLEAEAAAAQMLAGLFSTQSGDYLTEVEENSVILIKSLASEEDYEELERCAATAVDMLGAEAMVDARAAYGTIVTELKDLSKSYKEARMAMDVGQIFYAGRRILSYNELGIGRLIYQLPVNLCRMFLHEIFGDYDPGQIDQETLATIQTFFDNNLNVSETSRQLFIHRNTLVYRMEKLQKATGLDIRTFEDAMTFRIALMVSEYMKFLERKT
ncbi:MAG: helix-turn-helix domain-containing protein [Lachnospiraceae bacterium]|nr:helix-turn-helix domain-containing protein [Lachnospiraceae bacterium]